ncbi:MAG: hypothetical protein C0506_13495 [Anaerolinea sp.]|nr:hypothetical protein [Anaerolinea sp.]
MAVIQFPLTLKGKDTGASEAPRVREFTPLLAQRPRTNALWGVPGKQALLERLEVIGALAPEAPLSFVVVRVYGLEAIQQRKDASAADALLHDVAARMRELARGTDVMGRLSSSSFGLVLQGTGATAAGAVAARLSHHLNQIAAASPPAEVRVSAATGRGMNAAMLPGAAMDSFEECC